jgi:hypothetical protein
LIPYIIFLYFLQNYKNILVLIVSSISTIQRGGKELVIM